MSINWQPIESIPLDRKNGRDMLLWDKAGEVAVIGQFGWRGIPVWSGPEGEPIDNGDITHWADINPPEDKPE